MILFKLGEGIKEQGSCVEAISWNEDRTFKAIEGDRPIVGCSLRVGSVTARTFSSQDWWLTTVVTEILDEQEHEGKLEYCKFKTENSVYELYSEGYKQRNKNVHKN